MTCVVGNILIVDDEESLRLGCTQALEQDGYRARAVGSGKDALELFREEAFDAAIVDLRMPGLGGLELLERVHREDPDLQVVVITGYATIESAVEAMRLGAYDYLPKPFTPEMLCAVVRRAVERRRLTMENIALKQALKERAGADAMVGVSEPMQAVMRLIHKAAPSDATVLIIGATGSGKELVARAVHEHSPRRERPFVAVDCGALVEGLFESELFGHVRGAYTGAVDTTVGKFELASGGTLFFDEIGNLGLEMQVKLLRVLQEREITKVGGTQRIKVDVRIVAATNSDLAAEVRAGEFREDLFYRLSVVPIHLPPLRERRDDIIPLAEHFLRKYGTRRNRSVRGFSPEALRALERHHWPGNVRELENTVERALVMSDSTLIRAEDLFFYGASSSGDPPPTAATPASLPAPGTSELGRLAESERREIALALERFDWQMARAAEFLGINRKTLREKIRRYGLAQPPAKP
jgi:DNA-binding NtrC family response regulator